MTTQGIEKKLRDRVFTCVSIRGCDDIWVTDEDVREFRKYPLQWISEQLMCSPEEFMQYMEAVDLQDKWGYPRCEATTIKGDRCRNMQDDAYPITYSDWIKNHRNGDLNLCRQHSRIAKKKKATA